MMENALKVIENELWTGSRVGVALSGGADSTCLFYLLLESVGRERIVAINIEHGIRGESSLRDSEFVRALCEKEGVELLQKSVDIPSLCKESGRSEETEARLVRRQFFDEILESGKVDYIATAHHLGDKVESVLMHLFRGCGINGLIGQSALDGQYLHPLISVKKDEILKYLSDRNIPFVTDESNFDDKYTRNFVRNEIIPKIAQRYDIYGAIESVSQSAKEDERFIRSCMDARYLTCRDGEVSVDLTVFSLPNALVVRYITDAVKTLSRLTDFERKHIQAVIALASGENGKKINLGRDLNAVKEYDQITFFLGEKKKVEQEEYFALGLTAFGNGYIEIYPSDGEIKSGVLTADLDLIPLDSVIRTRRNGDIIKPFGSGTKKLKEYFIDEKIPSRKRNELPLLCNGNEVLAVFGVEISERIKVTEKTKNAVTLKYTED